MTAFRWQVNWKLTALSLLLFAVLLRLGFWQLSRADEKQTIQDQWQQQQAQPAVTLNDNAALIDGRRVRVTGKLNDEHYWLLENRIFDGRLGFDVLMLLERESGPAVLVNRGWVAAAMQREQNPQFDTPTGWLTVTGTLKAPSDSVFISETLADVQDWPARILEINMINLSNQVAEPLLPQLLLLDADSVGALAVNWQPVNMQPSRHRAYAVQWFAMAAALFVLWVLSNSNLWQRSMKLMPTSK